MKVKFFLPVPNKQKDGIMGKILNDLWGDASQEQFWLWCDIDGHGQQWKLVVPLDDEQIFFPHDQFEDYVYHYLTYPAREIVKPLCPDNEPD